MQMLQKLVLIKHLKEQMEDGDKSEASSRRWTNAASRTHLGQLPLGVERHQDEDVGHCGRYTTHFSSAH